MKFVVNTKPFADALSLAIIPKNVSDYYDISTMAQITVMPKELIINTEASRMQSEVHIQGASEGVTEPATVFVKSLQLKALVDSFESNTVTIEFTPRDGGGFGGIILHSGNSKFTLANVSADEDSRLKGMKESGSNVVLEFNQEDWAFIQKYQMYALGMSFVHGAYTLVYMNDGEDVIVGDYDTSIFTHSKKSNLNRTCLISPTVINLMNAVGPEATFTDIGDGDYQVEYNTEVFSFKSQFHPSYEDDVGSYNADIILSTFQQNEDSALTINISHLGKFLSQSKILEPKTSDTCNVSVRGNHIDIVGNSVDYHADVSCVDKNASYEISLNMELFRRAVSNLDADEAKMCAIITDGEVTGINLWTDQVSVVVAGVE